MKSYWERLLQMYGWEQREGQNDAPSANDQYVQGGSGGGGSSSGSSSFLQTADEFEFFESFEVSSTSRLSGWLGEQLVRGSMSISDETAHSGNSSLYMRADNNIGKAHPYKAVWVEEGDYAQAVAHVYIPSGHDLSNLYFMDWESKSSGWPPQPGIRLAFWGGNGDMVVERGKMGIGSESDFRDKSFVMPRDQWVKIDWRLKAGIGDEGATQVFVNDKLVIDGRGTTYLDPEVAAQRGIRLDDDYGFDRFKVGITANSTSGDLEMLVDDVGIATWDGGSPDWIM